jgi:hypothetical protein
VALGAPGQLLSPDQLDNLVAPVALYPDQLLSQVLAASTYPLEIVEAQQWLQQNGNLQGPQLIEGAKRQNWDPSVQALVAFPDAVAMLTRDIQWTTALGNAFLAQQSDVMIAIQRMRARAQNNGRLSNTPQQIVTTEAQYGQNAIAIQPANPQVMYVPSYNPQYVWGPPAYGEYPPMSYPPVSSGFGFGQLINLASFFTGFAGIDGLLTGGWGWVLSWFTHSLLLNGLFFSHFGFHGGGYGGGYGVGGAGYGARSAWVHNPGHRLGVPYSNQAVASRFGGTFRAATYSTGRAFSSGGAFAGASRATGAGEWHSASNSRSFNGASSFGSRGSAMNSYGNIHGNNFGQGMGARGLGSGFSSFDRGYSRGSETLSASARGFSDPRSAQHFSQPRASSEHFSAPHMSAPHFSAPHASGSHSSGGHGSGGKSHGGGSHRK